MLISTTVSDIADPDARSIAIGPFGSSLKAEMYEPSGVAVIRGQNIVSAPQIDEGDLVFVSPETASKFPACLVSEGDLVFPHRGAIGRVGIVGSRPMLLSSSMMKLRCDRTKVDPLFMLYYFRGPGKDQLLMRASTVGTPGIGQPLTSLRGIPLSIPPLVQQQAIAEVLGALDDKIAANTKLAETLADMATAQFNLQTKAAAETVPLDTLVTTQYGLTTSSHEGPGPQFLRVTDINKKPWIEWATTPCCTVSESELEKYRVKPGDILVARMADPGKAAFIDIGDPEAVFASYLVRLKALDNSHALFIYYFLRSATYRNYAEGAMQGSVQKNMNAKVIVATDIRIPSITVLREFNEVVTKIRAQIQWVLKENLKLVAVRDTLLPQLMSGKLKVKQAEEIVASAL